MFFLFDFLLTFSIPCSFHIGLMGPRQSQELEEEEEVATAIARVACMKGWGGGDGCPWWTTRGGRATRIVVTLRERRNGNSLGRRSVPAHRRRR
jgi:hypothetical protein